MPAITVEELKKHLHYDPETGVFTRIGGKDKRWLGTQAGCKTDRGCIRIGIGAVSHRAHALAVFYVTGRYPTQIDHINGVRDDNRIANLREVSNFIQAQNKRGARSDSISGRIGALKAGGRWVARITSHKVRIALGTFDTPEEASQAYIAAKRILHQGCTI